MARERHTYITTDIGTPRQNRPQEPFSENQTIKYTPLSLRMFLIFSEKQLMRMIFAVCARDKILILSWPVDQIKG